MHSGLRQALSLACLLVVGCSSAQGHTVARRNAADTVVVRSQQEPDTLNPTLTNSIACVDVTTPIFNGLITIDDHMRPVPDLITELPSLANHEVRYEGKGMAVTYHLRPNVRFHDGVPLTSHDIWYCWKMHMDPKVLVASRDGYDKIASVDTPDPLTAVVHFKEPYAPFLTLFSLPNDPIFPAHILEKSDDVNLDGFNRAPIGTGPFKFKEWAAGDHVGLVANPDYFGGAPRLKKLYFKFIPDDNAAFIQLANGDIDVYADFNLEQLEPAAALTHVRIVDIPALTYEQLSFNLTRPLFQERAVRVAMASAIDKAAISHSIFQGRWQAAHSTEHPLAWSFSPDLPEPYPYDPPRARALLDAAGWKPGPDGIRVKHGVRLSFNLTTTAGRKLREQEELVLAGYFKAVGIEATISNVEGGLLFAAYPSGLLQGAKYDVALFAYSASIDPAGSLSNWHTGQIPPEGQNTTQFRNAEMDRVLDGGNRELDQTRRKALYHRMTEILNREEPIIPLVYWTEMHGVNRQLHNFRANPTSSRFVWNCRDWYLDIPEATP